MSNVKGPVVSLVLNSSSYLDASLRVGSAVNPFFTLGVWN